MLNGYRAADERVWDVLDSLEITEYSFHDSNYTRPLVSHLVDGVMGVAQAGGRVLVLGGNRLLIEALTALGYRLEIWQYGRQISEMPASIQVSARLNAEDLAALRLPSGRLEEPEFQAIVLPMVLETLRTDLRPLLRRFATGLETGGALISATTNLFKLGTRWRALLGQGFLPGPRAEEVERAGGWHSLPIRRFYSTGELKAYAEASGFQMRESRLTSGYRIYDHQRPLGPAGWAKALIRQGIVHALPGSRSYLITYWHKQ